MIAVHRLRVASSAWLGAARRQLAGIPAELPAGRPGSSTARMIMLNALLALALAGAAAAAVYGLRHKGSTAAPAARTVTAQRGVVLSTVSATGNVQAPAQLNVNFENARPSRRRRSAMPRRSHRARSRSARPRAS